MLYMCVLTSLQILAPLKVISPYMHLPSLVRFQVRMHWWLALYICSASQGQSFSGGGNDVGFRVFASASYHEIIVPGQKIHARKHIFYMACLPKQCISGHDRAQCSLHGHAGPAFAQNNGRTVDRTGSKGPMWFWPQAMVPRAQGGERKDFHQIVQMGPIIHCFRPGPFDG